MCFSSLFKTPKIETPPVPQASAAVAAAPIPSPTPTQVESQSTRTDIATKRKKQLRSGLLSTIKSGGVFGSGAELGTSGKSTLG